MTKKIDYDSIPMVGRPIDAIAGDETAHPTVQLGLTKPAPVSEEEEEEGDGMTKDELKAALDAAKIEYPSKANKAELIDLYNTIPE